jgi:hypothetical protein
MPNTMVGLDGRIYRSTGEQARGVAPADIGMTPQQRFLCVHHKITCACVRARMVPAAAR